MDNFYPYFTNDGSVGLYSRADDDVYHSTFGAITEAYEKFILPAQFEKYFQKNSEIKILDICFGIGYNTKSFLNFLYNAQIYSNNINKVKYNDKIHGDNINSIKSLHEAVKNKKLKIFVKGIDTNKILPALSPFIKCRIKKYPKYYKLPLDNEKIIKMMSDSSSRHSELVSESFPFFDEINWIILEKIAQKYPEIYQNQDIFEIFKEKEYGKYLDKNKAFLSSVYNLIYDNHTPLYASSTFLHNIYYRNISISYKRAKKWLRINDFDLELKIEDARQSILKDNNRYNFIFLDAFTSTKCPCLWTVDFFKQLYEHLDEGGMILTYSNSASVRGAFLEAGFNIGKIFTKSSNSFMGTVAVKNKSLIEHELTEYDLRLIKTTAGIFYRDENLNGSNEEIFNRRELEVKNSDRISSSQFKKLHR